MVSARLSPDPSARGVIRYPDYALGAPSGRDRDGRSRVRPGSGRPSCIEREFAGWHPWVSGGRTLLGGAEGQLGPPHSRPGRWAMTVDADDPQGFRAEITQQEQHAVQAGAA